MHMALQLRDYIDFMCKEKEEKEDSPTLRVWFGSVWFYGISTIAGYLMPDPFLYI